MSNEVPRIEPALKTTGSILLRDPQIREPWHHWLLNAHADDLHSTEILHELKIPRPSARIDIAVINGEMCGFEIKSDVDSLARLSRQERAFSAIFDRVSVVVTSRHIKAAKQAIPTWWGIIVAKPLGPDVSFSPKRMARENRNPNTAALLYMLTRQELIEILKACGLANGLRGKHHQHLVEALLASISAGDIRKHAKSAFKKRAVFYSGSSSSSSS
jgi:hypothetical protein